jgi:hypothetical protein
MINQLMKFRLAYLRAIATAWNDDGSEKGFKKKFIETEDLLESNDPEITALFGDIELGNVSIRIIDNPRSPAEWHPRKTAGWIGPDDYYIINLPAKPHIDEQAQALAAFYELFPTSFGRYEKEEVA